GARRETPMILAVGEALMELRRVETRGELAAAGTWHGPFCSGAPAIFASVAARLGAPTVLAAAVGDDPFGRHLTARLHHDGVGGQALSTAAGRATALAMVAYDAVGERDFFFSVRGSAAEAIDIAAAVDAARAAALSGSTNGPGGAELRGPGIDGPITGSAPVVEEVDATGAGDSFAAAFLAALESGAPPERAASAACAIAARCVTVMGAMEAE